MASTDNYRWIMLGLCTFCILTFGVVFQSIPPLIGILVEHFHISYAQAGALMALFILPSIFLSLPGGLLVDRYGAKSIGIASLFTMALGTALVAPGTGFWVIGLGRLVAGIGAALLLVVAPKVVTSWFHGREIGLSMGIFNTSMPLGTILSLNFMGLIAQRFNWQSSIWTSLAVTLAALSVFILLYRGKGIAEDSGPSHQGLLTLLKGAGGGIWRVGICWGLFNAGLISFFTYSPDYFVSRGADVASAGLIASYPMWGSIVLAPLVGAMIDKIGRRGLLVSVGCGGIAMMLILIPRFVNHATLLSISIGIFVALLTPAIFSFPAELLPRSLTGLGFGILGTALGVGISVGPYVVGILRDITGSYEWSFAAMALLSALGIFPMLRLKRDHLFLRPS